MSQKLTFCYSRCDIDSSNDVVYLNITGGHNKSKLILEMVQGFHTQNLVAEIFRLSEDNNRANLHFEWIDKYLPQGKQSLITFCQQQKSYHIFC